MIFKDPSNPNVSVILKFVLFHLTKYMWKKKKGLLNIHISFAKEIEISCSLFIKHKNKGLFPG